MARTARIFREKGTNRDDFIAGKADLYSWVDLGSSLVMPEVSAALARAQLGKLNEIVCARRRIAGLYDVGLAELERHGTLRVVRPNAPQHVTAHHIYAVLVDPARRGDLVATMARSGVQVSSHFVPLHSSPYGRSVAASPELPRTDRLAASLIRLPIYPGLSDRQIDHVVSSLTASLSG